MSIECSFSLTKPQNIMPVYDDNSQEDASSVEMKKRTKEMKIRVAKVIYIFCLTALSFAFQIKLSSPVLLSKLL